MEHSTANFIKLFNGRNQAHIVSQVKQSPITMACASLVFTSATGLFIKLSLTLHVLQFTLFVLPLLVATTYAYTRDRDITILLLLALVVGSLISLY